MATKKTAAKPAVAPVAETAPAKETKATARDFGKEIDGLKDLMRRNGWSV